MGYLHPAKRPPLCIFAAERSLPLFRLTELRLSRVGVIYVDPESCSGVEEREPHVFVLVTARPDGCSQTSPASKSSKKRLRQPSFIPTLIPLFLAPLGVAARSLLSL
jgi:hypothetical protein